MLHPARIRIPLARLSQFGARAPPHAIQWPRSERARKTGQGGGVQIGRLFRLICKRLSLLFVTIVTMFDCCRCHRLLLN